MSKEEKNSKKARDDKKIDGLMGKIHFAQNAYLDGYEGSTEDFCKLFHYLIRDGRGDEVDLACVKQYLPQQAMRGV